MAPIDLSLLPAFAAVHATGSFTAAAARLGVPRSTVSRAIAALEDQLGETLVHRTTRVVAISDEGKELYDRIAPALGALTAALADRPEHREEPAGALRVTSTSDLGTVVLADAIVRFTTRYPRTEVELVTSPTVFNLARDGFDLALRVSRSRLADSTLRAQRVGAIDVQLFAAPSYLARRGAPRALRELDDHDCVRFSTSQMPSGAGRTPRELTRGRIVCDDMFVRRELLRRGGGIGALPSFLAVDDVRAGALAPVLERLSFGRVAVYLVQPARKHVAPRVTAFRDLVLELLRQRPLAPTTLFQERSS